MLNPRRRCCYGHPRVRRDLSSWAGRRLGRFVCRAVLPARMRLVRSGCGRRLGVLLELCCWFVAVSALITGQLKQVLGKPQSQSLKRPWQHGCAAQLLLARGGNGLTARSAQLHRKKAARRVSRTHSGAKRISFKKAAAAPRQCVAPKRPRDATDAATRPRSAPRNQIRAGSPKIQTSCRLRTIGPE